MFRHIIRESSAMRRLHRTSIRRRNGTKCRSKNFVCLRICAFQREPRPPMEVIISGLESTKEEARTMEDGFLRRGMATFTFDGPGQGETWFQGGMIVDFERATSAVIDYLEKLSQVDANQLGVFGPSMGGYLAPRSAACDKRIKACAFAGGMYDRSRVLNRLDDPFEFARISHIWKVYDKEKLVELHRQCTLEGLASKIRCPLRSSTVLRISCRSRRRNEPMTRPQAPKSGCYSKAAIMSATTCLFATARSLAISSPSTWERRI